LKRLVHERGAFQNLAPQGVTLSDAFNALKQPWDMSEEDSKVKTLDNSSSVRLC
jgi:hypothetical protein